MVGERGWFLKQKMFCDEYIRQGGNATEAYMITYKSKSRSTARRAASTLMKKPHVHELIKESVEESGLNDVVVDLKLRDLITQDENKSVKLNAIKEYNKLKRRGIYDKRAQKREEEQREKEKEESKQQTEAEKRAYSAKLATMTPTELEAERRRLLDY